MDTQTDTPRHAAATGDEANGEGEHKYNPAQTLAWVADFAKRAESSPDDAEQSLYIIRSVINKAFGSR